MTKKIFLFTLLICLLPVSFMAQVWGNGALGINFQAVVRDDAGQPISGMLVDVQVKIKDQSTNATLYSEQFLDVATDGYGLMNFVIGDGSPMIGFTNAEFDYDWWFSNPVYVEVSYSGGGPYTVLGTYPLEAVPYAFSSRVAEMAKTPLFGLDELYEMSTEDATDGQIIVRVGTTWDNKDPQWKPGPTAGTIVNHQSANTRVGITNATGESVTSAGILSVNKEIAAGNTVDDVITLTRMTSGLVNNGLGAGLGFYTETTGGNVAEVGQLSGVLEEYVSGNGALQFSTRSAGVLGAKMRLESSGDLGIGTTIPQQALHVHRSGSTEARIKLTNSTTGDLSPDGFEITQGGLHTYLTNLEAGSLYLGTDNNLGNFVIRPSGEMGFGTWNNNLAKFQFEGVNGNTSAAFRSNSTTSAGMSMIADWPGLGFNAYYNGGFKSMGSGGYMGHITCDQTNGGFIFGLGTTAVTANGQAQTLNEKMRLTKEGYIGLGIATPARQLHIHSETNGVVGIQMTTAGTGYGAASGGFLKYEYGYSLKLGTNQPTEDVEIFAGDALVMTITDSRNVGIN
ncbi:MAG: hypothetical protein JNM00_09825, partial [Flavobacteriales bacterium]|nr:hypothetical protein [Flavobacteriales bacterium]